MMPPKASAKYLDSRVADPDSNFWGKKDGQTYHVYVRQSAFSSEQLQRALDELERINASPYRPSKQQVPSLRYKKHKQTPLKGKNETVLAHVLYEVGILATNSVEALHVEIRNEGSLFGTLSEDGEFAVYLSDKHTAKVKQALALLESMQPTRTSASDESSR